jgi:hypothetical protein
MGTGLRSSRPTPIAASLVGLVDDIVSCVPTHRGPAGQAPRVGVDLRGMCLL